MAENYAFATPHPGREFCWWSLAAQLNGSNQQWSSGLYITVFKSGSRQICGQTGAQRSLPPKPVCEGERDVFTFTFVRDPLEHFVSGYSEIVHRVARQQRKWYRDCYERGCYSWLGETNVTRRAHAFVADFVKGRVHNASCCPQTAQAGDLHAIPQSARS